MRIFRLSLLLLGAVQVSVSTEISVSLDDRRFFLPSAYLNKLYFISRATFASFGLARATCESARGYVAEIDNLVELIFLENFLTRSDVAKVYVAGTDAAFDGRWVSQRTGATRNVFDWSDGEPNNFNGQEECIELIKSRQSRMNDIVCNNPLERPNVLCEIDLF
ncbi:perlucin-like [Biomphalaria glabrata]|uniref:Perlucin-like n=1 Tax=Biomphalaria glabrata TaxID=6526 RepID=A0A9W2YDB1_BIOGL|nr:perlucin-like [Biomphalaria glabrata]XP_055860757.1 perlucin-like [Biomphalaria glabrata]XP_055860758.1 perlucin-like [Biomphalaria glabrata]XP_055860759.1 perlucin-like [Biomphalaria glabrata]